MKSKIIQEIGELKISLIEVKKIPHLLLLIPFKENQCTNDIVAPPANDDHSSHVIVQCEEQNETDMFISYHIY